MRLDAPIEPSLVKELFRFWEPIFEGQIDVTPETLLGDEVPQSHVTVYITRLNGRLAGACLLAGSNALPSLAGLGEVATDPEARRGGIATKLSRIARDDFAESGGQAIFLGTVNPNAARIYHRLGWRKLAGANLMLNVLNGDSPEEFLVDYFREIGSVKVREPSPADRVSMIPLLVSPHDWRILDSNTGMLSTRYAPQNSCLGLYRRYSALTRRGRGTWFCASDDRARLAGLSSARLDGSGGCQVDGFTRIEKQHSWGELVRKATEWGADKGASPIWAKVSVEDEEKIALFKLLGFEISGSAKALDLAGNRVETFRLELV